MKIKDAHHILQVAALLSCAFSTGDLLAQPATGPLTVHPVNPRYFADAAGKPVYLTGSHTWTNLQDEWTDAYNKTFDFDAYLNFLQVHSHNFIRLWRGEYPKYRYHITSEFTFTAPHPWKLVSGSAGAGGGAAGEGEVGGPGGGINLPPDLNTSGDAPGGAPGGGDLPIGGGNVIEVGVFDLSQFNQTYFDRLRARCIAAGNRGIYVSIMLFEGHALTNAVDGWQWHPFNIANNVNGVNGDPNGDGRGLETHTLTVPAVTSIQQAYVRKVIDTVNDLDNVMYEIANESHGDSVPWQNFMIDYIHSYEAGKPKRHPVLFSSPLAGVGNSLWQSHAEAIAPLSYSPNGSYSDDMPANDGSKVIIGDTDHIFGCGGNKEWIWKAYTRGLNPIYMDSYYEDTPFCPSPSESIRMNMGYVRSFALRTNLALAVPRGDLSSTSYCLAHVAHTYLAFAPNGGAITLNLTGVTGTFQVEWLNPATGAHTTRGTIQGGGYRTVSPPFSGPAAVFVFGNGSGNGNIVGDVNGDGDVDVDDMLAIISAWGPCSPLPAPCPADVNGDRMVDVDDLLVVLSHFSA